MKKTIILPLTAILIFSSIGLANSYNSNLHKVTSSPNPPIIQPVQKPFPPKEEPVTKPKVKEEKVVEPVKVTSPPARVSKTNKTAEESSTKIAEPPSNTVDFSKIDFKALKQKNNNFYCWLNIPSLKVDMPVVYDPSTGNDYFYLNHNFDKKESSGGWVYASRYCDELGFRFNTIFYGHNRADGQMFGSLKNLLSNPGDGLIYMATDKTRILTYKVVAICILKDNDWIYDADRLSLLDSVEREQEFIDEIKSANKLPNTEELKTSDKFVTLSTCYGGAGTTNRLVVFAKLIAGY